MRIKAIAPWFGGKRTMAPSIAKLLGEHRQYFEPFCGSMAVLFAKEPSRQETVNDLHGDLINLARVLQSDQAAELYDRAQRTLVSEDLLQQAEHELKEPVLNIPNATRAYWYFLSCWMARNGMAGMQRTEYQMATRWTAGGGSATIRFQSATESIPAWHQRLRNVVILKRDAFDIIPKFEDAQHTAIYVDPPYVSESRSAGAYEHDFTDRKTGTLFDTQEEDSHTHDRLARLLRQFQHARVVVSYYDCHRVRSLYQGWTFVDSARKKNLHAQNGRGKRQQTAPEVLITNA